MRQLRAIEIALANDCSCLLLNVGLGGWLALLTLEQALDQLGKDG